MIEPAIGDDPEPAGAVVQDLAHADVAQPVGTTHGDGHEPVRRRVMPQQAGGARPDPQPAGSIAVERLHIVVRQRPWPCRVSLVDPEAVAVPARQAAERTHPQKTLAVLGDRRGDGAWQPLFLPDMLEGDVRQHRPPPVRGRRLGSRGEHGEHQPRQAAPAKAEPQCSDTQEQGGQSRVGGRLARASDSDAAEGVRRTGPSASLAALLRRSETLASRRAPDAPAKAWPSANRPEARPFASAARCRAGCGPPRGSAPRD